MRHEPAVTRARSKLSEPNNDDTDTCPICYESLKIRDVTTLGCSHRFHSSCIMTNVMTNGTKCPMCRQPAARVMEQKESSDESDGEDQLMAIADRIQSKFRTSDVNMLLKRFHIPNDIRRMNHRERCELLAEQITYCTDNGTDSEDN